MALNFQNTGTMTIRHGGVTEVVDSWTVRHLGVDREVDTFWIGTAGGQESVSFGYNQLTVTGTETSVDLATYIPGDGFPFKLQITVAAGALVQPPVGSFAIYSSLAFPANSDIILIIDGQVLGENGAGGRGGGWKTVTPTVGGLGASCISLPCPADITMGASGELFSGGGGGGGGGKGGENNDHPTPGFELGAGGGGGQPGGTRGQGESGENRAGVNGVTAATGFAAGGAGYIEDGNEYGGRGGDCAGSGATGQTGQTGRDKDGNIQAGEAGGPGGNAIEANGHAFTYDLGDLGSKIKGGIIA